MNTIKTIEELKVIAFEARNEYRIGKCSREEAVIKIMPFIEAFNTKSFEVAKKHSLKPKKINFISFVR